MHYSAIILVIYDESLDVYSSMKRKSNTYYSMFSESVKIFYITFRENQDEDILEEGEFLYFKGMESFKPGIITKTMKAMDYITKRYSYDYVVRTNVSTIIDCKNLLDYLNTIPKINYTGGFVVFNSFYSGIFIVFSKDIAKVLSSVDLYQENIHGEMDDVLIMQMINKYQLPITDISNTKYEIEYCIHNDILHHNDIGENHTKYENILCYRIKNDSNRMIDLQYFDKILNRLSMNIE